MGVLLQIRDVDELVCDELKVRAAQAGVSLNSYLRDLLAREVGGTSRRGVLERIRLGGDRTDRPSIEVLAEARAQGARAHP